MVFYCFKGHGSKDLDILRLTIKTRWYVRCTYIWQLDDEYSSCCIEPSGPLNTCDDGNSGTNEPTLIEIWSKHLDANLSQGRSNLLGSFHLCYTGEELLIFEERMQGFI
jgi:hypothetical protein